MQYVADLRAVDNVSWLAHSPGLARAEWLRLGLCGWSQDGGRAYSRQVPTSRI